MKRPIQHIIEEESRKSFANLIPDMWVMNDFVKDYGKDIHVEIFHQNSSTGKNFICQLKGTSKDSKDGKLTIQIEIETIRYFASITTPILLVFYSTANKVFYGIWANALISTLRVKESQKMVSITLTDNHLIDRVFFDNLVHKFDNNIFSKTNLKFKGNSGHLTLIEKKIKRWLSFYFSEYYEESNFHFPVYTTVTVDDTKKGVSVIITNPDFSIKCDNKDLDSDWSSFFRIVLDDSSLSQLEYEILYYMCSAFFSYSPKNSLDLLLRILHQYNGRYKTFKSLNIIGNNAVEANCIMELQGLIDNAIEYNNFKDFQALNVTMFDVGRQNPQLLNLYKDNLKKAINNVNDAKTKGFLSYNLANFYRSKSDAYNASHYYQAARKFYPPYLKTFYWWHEYAGMLYVSNHFKLSSLFYSKSIELDFEVDCMPLTYGLRADAEFWSYNFEKCEDDLDSYFIELVKLDKLPTMHYAFMHLVCTVFISSGISKSNVDKILSEKLYAEGCNERNIDKLKKAIASNPLNYKAHYSLGFFEEEQKNSNEAFHAYLSAAVITATHEPSWMKCFDISLRVGQDEVNFSVLVAMVQIFGFEIFNKITDRIAIMQIELQDKENLLLQVEEWKEMINHNILPRIFIPKEYVIRKIIEE